MTLSPLALVAIVLVSALAGWFVGLYCERSAWNELIQRGIIPKPRNKS